MKGELKMADDSVDDLVIFDKSDDSHLATARAQQRICLIDLPSLTTWMPDAVGLSDFLITMNSDENFA